MNYNTFFFRRIVSGPLLCAVKSLPKSPLSKCNVATLYAHKMKPYTVSQKTIIAPLVNARWYETASGAIPEYKKHSHTHIWVMERVVSIGLFLSIPTMFTMPFNEHAECLADIFIAMHVHWGLEAIFTDYLRPSVVGNVIPKYCDMYASIFSIALAVGLLWVSIYGNGVARTAKQLWYLDETLE